MKKPFLKGSLTKLSGALLVLIQSPNLLADLSQTAGVFADSAAQPISVLTLAAAAGVLWGGFRRSLNYFGK